MTTLISNGFEDYQLVDSGEGLRLERFGKYTLVRPDPQAVWRKNLSAEAWAKADARFEKITSSKGRWIAKSNFPASGSWLLRYKNISFFAKPTPFKHTGVFPEQHLHWDWIDKKIRAQISGLKNETEKPNILNLFGYTGIATLVCAESGAKVTHVDASRPSISWARENQTASNLDKHPIRWILDDCHKFVKREIKRGVRYDGIIMDPPVYGHGPGGEVWDFYAHFPSLLEDCFSMLSEKPLFIVINAYAISASSILLKNLLLQNSKNLSGVIDHGELALQESSGEKRLLSTNIFARWSSN